MGDYMTEADLPDPEDSPSIQTSLHDEQSEHNLCTYCPQLPGATARYMYKLLLPRCYLSQLALLCTLVQSATKQSRCLIPSSY
jgi:hypothetical protein